MLKNETCTPEYMEDEYEQALQWVKDREQPSLNPRPRLENNHANTIVLLLIESRLNTQDRKKTMQTQ